MTDEELIPVRLEMPEVFVELPYATKDNFFGQVMYHFTEPLLRRGTVKKLCEADRLLRDQGYALKIWDGYRPYSVQCKMWDIYPVKGYVSDPKTGYLGHSRGNTVDVTLVRIDGTDVEMPSGFDDFSERANCDFSDATPAAAENARRLEKAMLAAGFDEYFNEWWHFPDMVEYPIIYDIPRRGSNMELSELLCNRRSVRAYKSETVRREQLEEMIRAAQLAPTWKNSQTGRYYIATEGEAYEKVRAALPDFNKKSSENAALIVTTFVRDTAGFTSGKKDNEPGNEWGAYDLGLQNAYMILKASELGLDTLIMGLRDGDALRAALAIPENEEIMAVIAVGTRAKEPVFKPRKPIEDIAHFL